MRLCDDDGGCTMQRQRQQNNSCNNAEAVKTTRKLLACQLTTLLTFSNNLFIIGVNPPIKELQLKPTSVYL